MFGRKKQIIQVEPEQSISMQMSRDTFIVESTDIETAVALVQWWEEKHGVKPESGKKTPLGFSADHMSDLESEIGDALPEEEVLCDDPDCEECEDVHQS